MEDTAVTEIAKRSRFTPRMANYFLKRCRDFAQVYKKPLNKDVVKDTLSLLDVDNEGLSSIDRAILDMIINKFGGMFHFSTGAGI